MLRLSKKTQDRTESPARAGRRLSRLILTGFMGAGKSTVGALLAETLGWRFLDLDRVIEASCSESVAEIFRRHGEAYFRAQERQAIEQLIGERKIVLALGGGAVEDASTLSSLLHSPETCLVFLDAPLPELLARIQEGPRTRPLLTTREELEARHNRRLPLYRASHVTIETTGIGPDEVAVRVLRRVSGEWRLEERVHGQPR